VSKVGRRVQELPHLKLYLGSCGALGGIKPNSKSFRLVVFIFATFCKDGVSKDCVLKVGFVSLPHC